MRCLLVSSLLVASALAAGCATTADPPRPAAYDEGGVDRWEFDEVTDSVWVHTTYRDLEGVGPFPANGLVLVSSGEALLVDTGWGDRPDATTRAILSSVRQAFGVPFTHAVLAHHHDDSVGGIAALRYERVPTLATRQTAALMEADGWGRPDSTLALGVGEAFSFQLGSETVEVFYPGPGHTNDNVVVYLPGSRVLFGGCLVRPAASGRLGNLADADVEAWGTSVARVRERYGDRVEVVVPSHGPRGGPDLLDHTIALVERQRAAGAPGGG